MVDVGVNLFPRRPEVSTSDHAQNSSQRKRTTSDPQMLVRSWSSPSVANRAPCHAMESPSSQSVAWLLEHTVSNCKFNNMACEHVGTTVHSTSEVQKMTRRTSSTVPSKSGARPGGTHSKSPAITILHESPVHRLQLEHLVRHRAVVLPALLLQQGDERFATEESAERNRIR